MSNYSQKQPLLYGICQVCGSDGLTYGSPCSLTEESVRRELSPKLPELTMDYWGPCKEVRMSWIARDCQRLPDCRDDDVAGADHNHAANGHARTRGGQLDFGLRGARIPCPHNILAGGVVTVVSSCCSITILLRREYFEVFWIILLQYDNVEGVTILLPADDQDISIQVLVCNQIIIKSSSWRNVLIEFFSSQMRGGPEPLMVTGWAQIVSLDPSYRWEAFH